MTEQKDVFEIIARIDRKIAEREAEGAPTAPPPRPELQLQEVELGSGFPCSSCGRFSFHTPTTCHWCRL